MSPEPMPTAHKIDRRRFLQGVGVAGAAGVGLSGRGPARLGAGAVGGAQALPPFVVAGAAATVGWALYESEILGSDPPVDGLGPEAFKQGAMETIRARKSNNKSTFVDNNNIADGIVHTAYTDGKIAAIEELNAESSLEDVQQAADDAASDYLATVQKNLLKSWNESVREFWTLFETQDQLDINSYDFLGNADEQSNDSQSDYNDNEVTTTLANGEEFSVKELEHLSLDSSGSNNRIRRKPMDFNSPNRDIVARGDDETIAYLGAGWVEAYSGLVDAENEVLGGLQNWTANIYSEVQSGSIDVADLLTPREQAELLSGDEEYPQAVADLIALNIPVDPDREATISFTESDITISGLMAPTSPPENGFVSGETYDPSASDWDLYFTYDPSRGAGGWSEAESDIPEGQLTFTDGPYEGVLYRVPTTTGDTVEVTAEDFTESESGGTWTADVSEQVSPTVTDWTDYETSINGGDVTFTSLPDVSATFVISANDGGEETVSASDFSGSGPYTVDTSLGIAEISEVEATIERTEVDPEETTDMFSEDGSAEYETVQISEPFTIDKIEDGDGNEVQESEFSQTEPQDDTNYITQEEWDELQEQNQELIEKYEDATDDGGFGGLPGWGDIGDVDIGDVGGATLAVGVAVAVVAFGAIRQVISLYLPGR